MTDCTHPEPYMVCCFCHWAVDTDHQYCARCKEGPGRVEWFCPECEATAENVGHNDIGEWEAPPDTALCEKVIELMATLKPHADAIHDLEDE